MMSSESRLPLYKRTQCHENNGSGELDGISQDWHESYLHLVMQKLVVHWFELNEKGTWSILRF